MRTNFKVGECKKCEKVTETRGINLVLKVDGRSFGYGHMMEEKQESAMNYMLGKILR